MKLEPTEERLSIEGMIPEDTDILCPSCKAGLLKQGNNFYWCFDCGQGFTDTEWGIAPKGKL